MYNYLFFQIFYCYDISLDYNIIIKIYKLFTIFVLHTKVWLKLCRSIIISTTYYGLQPMYKLLVDILTVIWHFKSTINILFHGGGSRLHKKLIILKWRLFYFIFTTYILQNDLVRQLTSHNTFYLWPAWLKLYIMSYRNNNIDMMSTRT